MVTGGEISAPQNCDHVNAACKASRSVWWTNRGVVVVADPRGERVPAGAGLARLAGGRGARGGAAQADGAVEAFLALVEYRLRRRGARHARAARHRRGAAVVAQPHRDRGVTAAAAAAAPAPRAPRRPARRRQCRFSIDIGIQCPRAAAHRCNNLAIISVLRRRGAAPTEAHGLLRPLRCHRSNYIVIMLKRLCIKSYF